MIRSIGCLGLGFVLLASTAALAGPSPAPSSHMTGHSMSGSMKGHAMSHSMKGHAMSGSMKAHTATKASPKP